jgi:hypothetical protein
MRRLHSSRRSRPAEAGRAQPDHAIEARFLTQAQPRAPRLSSGSRRSRDQAPAAGHSQPAWMSLGRKEAALLDRGPARPRQADQAAREIVARKAAAARTSPSAMRARRGYGRPAETFRDFVASLLPVSRPISAWGEGATSCSGTQSLPAASRAGQLRNGDAPPRPAPTRRPRHPPLRPAPVSFGHLDPVELACRKSLGR